ncbi:unnamed protein product [Sympodiomycopsis kandeliae]
MEYTTAADLRDPDATARRASSHLPPQHHDDQLAMHPPSYAEATSSATRHRQHCVVTIHHDGAPVPVMLIRAPAAPREFDDDEGFWFQLASAALSFAMLLCVVFLALYFCDIEESSAAAAAAATSAATEL